MTAVEFYRKHLHALVSTGETEYKTEPEIFEQAKEMEKEQKIEFANWLDKLTPSQRVSVWSKDGSASGLFTMDNEQLFEQFKKVTFKSE